MKKSLKIFITGISALLICTAFIAIYVENTKASNIGGIDFNQKAVYSSRYFDLSQDGTILIKNAIKRRLAIGAPVFMDVNYTKNYITESFNFENVNKSMPSIRMPDLKLYIKGHKKKNKPVLDISTKNINDDAAIQKKSNSKKITANSASKIKKSLKSKELNKKDAKLFEVSQKLDIESPYFNIKDSTCIYRIRFNYCAEPYMTMKNIINSKKNVQVPFYSCSLKYFNDLKQPVDFENFRIYLINDGNKVSTFEYNFLPKTGAKYARLEIWQPYSFPGSLVTNNTHFYKYPVVKENLLDYRYTDNKGNGCDTVRQIFNYQDRSFIRTISSDYDAKSINVNSNTQYKTTVQAYKEYEPFAVNSDSIQYVGRDMKIHSSISNSNPYVTDYTTSYFSRFNNIALCCSSGYTSVETFKENNNYRINFYTSNPDDDKYFLLGEGGACKYIFTQLRKAQTSSIINYSILLNYRGPAFIPSRTPDGTHGTLIITHHPDSNSIARLKTMMFGTSNESSPLYGKTGFLYNRIPATWGFFSKTEAGLTGIDNPDYKKLITQMSMSGIEVVPHTVTGVAQDNTRNLIKQYMPVYKSLGITNWIDHSLSSGVRCGDIKSEGSVSGSPQYSMDLFKDYGFKYCWSYIDYPLTNGIDMLSDKEDLGHPVIFFSNDNLTGGNFNMYQWNTYRPKSFIKEVNSKNLDELVENDGVCILHDYFNHPMQIGKFYTLDNEGNYTLTPKFESILEMLAKYRSQNKLYIPTVKQFINYTLAIHNVDIKYLAPERFLIDNKNNTPVDGYTLIYFNPDNSKVYKTLNLKPGDNIVNIN